MFLCFFQNRHGRFTSPYVCCCVMLISARFTAFQPIKGSEIDIYKRQIINTFKKNCHFGNLPDQFIVIFKRLSTCDRCMAHAVTELHRVVAMIEIALSKHIWSLRMEWSMKNKFTYRILFPEIPTYFEITTSQTPSLVRSVWTFV